LLLRVVAVQQAIEAVVVALAGFARVPGCLLQQVPITP